jgi:hypothetical protein
MGLISLERTISMERALSHQQSRVEQKAIRSAVSPDTISRYNRAYSVHSEMFVVFDSSIVMSPPWEYSCAITAHGALGKEQHRLRDHLCQYGKDYRPVEVSA